MSKKVQKEGRGTPPSLSLFRVKRVKSNVKLIFRGGYFLRCMSSLESQTFCLFVGKPKKLNDLILQILEHYRNES